MTPLQYVLIAIAVIIMAVGLIMMLRGMRHRDAENDIVQVQYDKNGIPIIPRHERNLVRQPDIEDALAGETTIAPDRRKLQPIIADDPLDAHDTNEHYSDAAFLDASYENDSYPDASYTDTDIDTVVIRGTRTQSGAADAFAPTFDDGLEHDGINHYGSSQSQNAHSQTAHSQTTYRFNDSDDLGNIDLERSHNLHHNATQHEEEDLFSSLASATENLMPAIDQAPIVGFEENSPLLDEHLLAAAEQDRNSPLNNAQENINITLLPNNETGLIDGKDVIALTQQYGLKYGVMNMYHRYANKDGTGMLWFSMMGLTDEGIAPFNINSLPETQFRGLVLFLSLPHPKAIQGFDSMMSTVGMIASTSNMRALDEENRPITHERRQQLRERVRDYQHTLHTS